MALFTQAKHCGHLLQSGAGVANPVPPVTGRGDSVQKGGESMARLFQAIMWNLSERSKTSQENWSDYNAVGRMSKEQKAKQSSQMRDMRRLGSTERTEEQTGAFDAMGMNTYPECTNQISL